MEKAWKISKFFFQYFHLIGWQASDQESIVASKTVVSPKKPYHCLLYIVGNYPREGDLSNSLYRDDAKIFPSFMGKYSPEEDIGEGSGHESGPLVATDKRHWSLTTKYDEFTHISR